MIILPKKIQASLHTLVSAQDTKESEWDLEQYSQLCEKSLTWRGKDSAARTWKTRCKRVKWVKHLFSQTLKPSLTKSFVDSWTLCLSVFRASHSAKQDLGKQLKTLVTSFPTLQKESELCNQASSSQKTLKGFSVAKQEKENLWSNMSEEHWKKWVTEQRSEYSQRVKLARHISVNESSSLVYPTPSVAGCVEGGVAKNVEMTPTGFKATRENGTSYGAKLRDAVLHQWGTPNTMDHLPSRSYEAAIRLAKSGGRKKREKPGNLREQVDPMMVQAFQDAKEMQWLTPTGIDIERTPEGIEKRKKYRESIGRKYVEGCLTEQVVMREAWATPSTMGTLAHWFSQAYKDAKNWSTPRVNCDNTRPNRKGGIPLGQQVKEDAKSWSTPTQRDYKDSPNDKSGIAMTLGRQINGWERSQQDQTKTNTNGSNQEFSKKGYLNPNWVEQLMGLPTGWTALDYSEME